ncbi:MAG: alpha/beta fold hydrolase [Chloroflexota bacterium]
MKLKLHDFEIAYDDTGGDPSTALRMPLLFIHGFPLDRTYWAGQTRALGDVARVIAPDLRGFGESRAPAGAVTMDTFADDLRDLLDALGVQRAVVAGLSMGGYIAFAFYRKYAARVRALILADTRATPDTPEAKKGRDENIALAREKGSAAVAEKMFPKMLAPQTIAERADIANAARALMSRQPVEGVIAALGALRDRPDSTPTLAQIAALTQIIVGAEDTLTPPKDSEQMRDGVRGARLAVIPNAGHLSNLEQPDAFNQVVREFLQSL